MLPYFAYLQSLVRLKCSSLETLLIFIASYHVNLTNQRNMKLIYKINYLCSELVTKSSPCDDTQPYLHRIIALLKSTDSATAVETSRCVLFNWIRNVIKTSSCHLKIATYYFNISNGMHLKFHGNCLLCIGLQSIKFSQLFKINICLIKVVTNLFYIPL